MPTTKELQEKRLKVAADIRSLGAKKDQWNAEDEAAWKRANDDYAATMKDMEAAKASEDRSKEISDRLASLEADDKASTNRHGLGREDSERRHCREDKQRCREEEHGKPTEEDRAVGLQAWMRHANGKGLKQHHIRSCKRLGFNPRVGELDLRMGRGPTGEPAWTSHGRQEARAGLDVTTSGKGITTIPAGFMMELEKRLLAFGGPRNVCRVIRTESGNSMPWPTVNDTGNTGELLAEATTIGTSVDPTFAAVTFEAYKYSSKAILISQELLEDSAFDLSSEIGDMLGTRLGRIMGAQNTTGTGSAQPNGIVTAATAAITAASTTAFTGDELLALVHSLDPAYRGLPSVGFMCNDAVLLAIRKFKDGAGQYLWQPGLVAGSPDRLLGYPVTVNQHMSSTFTAAQKLVLFGAFEKFIIRDVANLRFYRLDERYRDTDQSGFVAFMRMDSDTVQAVALRLLSLAP